MSGGPPRHDGARPKLRGAPRGCIPLGVARSGAIARMSRSAARLLLVIAAHANQKDGRSYPSLRLLAEEAGVCRRTAGLGIQQLVKLGALEVEQRRGRVSTMRLTCASTDTTRAKPIAQGGAKPIAQGGARLVAQGGAKLVAPERSVTEGDTTYPPERYVTAASSAGSAPGGPPACSPGENGTAAAAEPVDQAWLAAEAARYGINVAAGLRRIERRRHRSNTDPSAPLAAAGAAIDAALRAREGSAA